MDPQERRVRSAQAEDLEAVRKLAQELRSEIGMPTSLGEERFKTCFHASLMDPHCRILIAELGGNLVGYLSIWRRSNLSHAGPAAFVDDLIVSEEARGKGLGTALLQEAMRYAKEWGCVEIEVSTMPENEGAQRLYREMGFEKRGVIWEQDLKPS